MFSRPSPAGFHPTPLSVRVLKAAYSSPSQPFRPFEIANKLILIEGNLICQVFDKQEKKSFIS
jgi:hypothetical protein